MIDRSARVHLIGIGGAGMSAIAQVLLARGYRVSGSDLRASEITRRLQAHGAVISIGHDAGHVAGADVVVVSRAVPELNVEVVAAHYRGLPVYHRAEVLAQILASGFGIAVVGTHGKTTTTAMTAHVLAAGGLDPTALIGADVDGLDGNVRIGAGRYVVAEVDESDGSLLHVRPAAAAVTSLDLTDHRDHYPTVARLVQTFAQFLAALPRDGFVVLGSDHRHVRELVAQVAARTVTYGLTAPARYTATIQALEGRQTRCTFRRDGTVLGSLTLHVPGRYNVHNALAATAVALELGMSFAEVAPALEAFGGVNRRFSVRGEVGGVMVVDDYAHNPVKVAAVLRAAKESWPDRRIIAVFQPHRYSRTQTTYRRFAAAFADADELVITELYPADETPIPGVSAALIVEAVRARRPVTFVAEAAAVVDHLLPLLRSGDLVLTLGAGDIGKAADDLVAALRAQSTTPARSQDEPGKSRRARGVGR
jgi:UDP-N-acetylmuramate--alanine ligase